MPSKGLAQVRLMARFSRGLRVATGLSGAWGSCLDRGVREGVVSG